MDKTKKIELLAPAGNLDILKVAVEAGADAVYLAGKKFGARAFANNFENSELIEAVNLAHERGIKVFVTVNTIVYEDEFLMLNEYLDFLYQNNVDALIVQDLGVINYIRTKYPDFEIHASTQMNIFDENALNLLENLGIKRVVLARETSLDDIKKITNKNLEIEVFAHGALCFSSSGNCLMSYSIGGRSGNRGECAQPCRKKYALIEGKKIIVKDKPLLSMKDLSTIQNIGNLIDAGITSLKIEGRMKSPEYVYTVIKAYHKAIDNYLKNKQEFLDDDIKKMKIVFNRTFTNGYIQNVNNLDLTTKLHVNHQGVDIGKVVKVTPRAIEIKLCDNLMVQDAIRISGKDEVGFIVQTMFFNGEKVKFATCGMVVKIPVTISQNLINGVVKKTKSVEISNELNNYLKTNHKKIPVTVELKIKYLEPLRLTISDGINIVELTGEFIDSKISNPKNDSFYYEMINKLNDTAYFIENAKIENDNIGFVSIKEINNLRREAVDKLNKLRHHLNREKKPKLNLNKNVFNKIQPSLEAIVHTKEQEIACHEAGINTIYTDYESNLMNVSRLKKGICDNMMVHNLSQIGKNSVVSPYFNVINTKAIEIINHFGVNKIYLSYELGLERLINMDIDQNLNIGYPVYGKMDAMITKHCIIAKSYGCYDKKCLNCINKEYKLVDEYNNNFTIFTEINDGCNNRVIDYKIRNEINNLKILRNLGINLFLLTFTTEKPDEIKKIISEYKKVLN